MRFASSGFDLRQPTKGDHVLTGVVPLHRKDKMKDLTPMGYIGGMLFVSFMLYSALPYVIAGLTACMVVFVFAQFQKK